MSIGRATADDLKAILVAERSGFDAAAQWSAESWRQEIEGPDRLVLVHRDSGGEVDAAATFQSVGDVADLHRVVVHPLARRRGIGSVLIAEGMAWAIGREAARMLLEVEHDNTPAVALYAGLGFVQIARRADYYGPGRHALVMEATLGALA